MKESEKQRENVKKGEGDRMKGRKGEKKCER